MKAYTVDTLWTTMIKKISFLSRAAVQIAACWYGHPVRYSSCVWCKHITSSKFSSSKLSTTNHGSCPDCTTVSCHHLQHCGPHSESQRFPCIPTLVRSRTSCALIVCWWSSTAFQFISSSQRQKSPDIFINSLTRCRNFRVSQSLAIGRGFRITRGAYLITMKQCPESSSVFDDIMRTRMFLLVCLCVCDVHVLTQSVALMSLQEPLHNLFDVIIDVGCRGFMKSIFAHRLWPHYDSIQKVEMSK